MDKKLALFLISAAVLVGCFLGSYMRRNQSTTLTSPLESARQLIDSAAGDQNKLTQASDILKAEIKTDPNNVTALFLQGRAFQQRGLIDQSILSYEQYFAKKLSMDYAASYNAGELYELKGDLQKAEKYFQDCVAVAPSEAGGWERLILVLLKEKNIPDAKEYLKSMKAVLPNSDVTKRLSAMVPQ